MAAIVPGLQKGSLLREASKVFVPQNKSRIGQHLMNKTLPPSATRLRIMHTAMSQNELCNRLIEKVNEELAGIDRPLSLDILPVQLAALVDVSEGDLMPLSYGCKFADADGFVVRIKYASHYRAIYSTLRYETSYVAAIHLSLETGLIYEGLFNV